MPSEPLHARSPKRRSPFLSLSALSEASLSQAQGFALLALVCLVSLFLFMGDTLFNTRGEPREAVVAPRADGVLDWRTGLDRKSVV